MTNDSWQSHNRQFRNRRCFYWPFSCSLQYSSALSHSRFHVSYTYTSFPRGDVAIVKKGGVVRCSRITIELPASTWDLVRMARSSPKHTPTYPKTKTTTKRLKRLQLNFRIQSESESCVVIVTSKCTAFEF